MAQPETTSPERWVTAIRALPDSGAINRALATGIDFRYWRKPMRDAALGKGLQRSIAVSESFKRLSSDPTLSALRSTKFWGRSKVGRNS
jgi:hypothetical protein